MAFSAEFLLCGIILVLLACGQGLEFSKSTIPGNQYCGRLRCSVHLDQNYKSISSIVGMTIYDTTKSTTKEKLASVSISDSPPELYIQESKREFFTAFGSVSRYHAELTLNLKRVTDCVDSSFQCEIDFLSVSGQLESQQKMLAPLTRRDADGSSDLSQTFADLSTRGDHIASEITRLSNAYDDLVARLNNYLGGNQNTGPTGAPATRPTGAPVTQPTGAPVTPPTGAPVTPLTSRPDTTQTPVVTSCVSGMSHDPPRVIFTLPGNVQTLCDAETDGGGWIIIQRRTKGDVDFYKNWADYKKGFGTPSTDYWLGNDVIHSLTSQGYTELRVDIEDQANKAFAHYSTFQVGDESSNYKLTVSGYTGTAGDSLSYHNGMSFTTHDQDNDVEIYYNCGEYFHGAWWYKDCFDSNLNGEWGKDSDHAIIWKTFLPGKAVSFSEIKVRKA